MGRTLGWLNYNSNCCNNYKIWYYFKFDNIIVLVFCLIVFVFSATLGDLFESKIKAEAEVKDSGKN